MAAKDLIIDTTTIDFNHVVADLEEIRRYNLQRFEMEQLTAIVLEDRERTICVGYKDTSHQDFWVRGHMPGMPLMPGVVMLECAAQLCSYYAQKLDLLGTRMIGFGGLEDVRFRDTVRPGDRLPCTAIRPPDHGAQRHRPVAAPPAGRDPRAAARRRLLEGSARS